MRTRLTTTLVAAVAVVALAITASASALSGDISAGALKSACETSPGNVVNLTDSVKIDESSASVSTGCTINIPETKALELTEGARLSFAGPLKIVGAVKTKVELVESSSFSAPAIELDFRQFESEVKVDRSQLAAGAGGVTIMMGDVAKAQFAYTGGLGPSITTSGPIDFSAGTKLAGELNNVTLAGGGITFRLNGADSVLKAEASTVRTNAAGQSVAFDGTGAKTLIEAKGTTFSAHDGLRIALAGAESTLKTADGSRFVAGGNLDLAISAATGSGLLELANTRLEGIRVGVGASSGSEKGKAIFKLGTGIASDELAFRTGALGTTEVLESSLTAVSAIRITTGAGGTCKQEKNTISAPLQQLCA